LGISVANILIYPFLFRKERKEKRPKNRTLAVRFCPAASDLALGVFLGEDKE